MHWLISPILKLLEYASGYISKFEEAGVCPQSQDLRIQPRESSAEPAATDASPAARRELRWWPAGAGSGWSPVGRGRSGCCKPQPSLRRPVLLVSPQYRSARRSRQIFLARGGETRSPVACQRQESLYIIFVDSVRRHLSALMLTPKRLMPKLLFSLNQFCCSFIYLQRIHRNKQLTLLLNLFNLEVIYWHLNSLQHWHIQVVSSCPKRCLGPGCPLGCDRLDPLAL